MFDFFYNEFKNLKALTGFNQWEKLNEGPDPEKAIREVINPMVQVTQFEPFRIVKPAVLQRVIHNAIMTDSDFTGLNAKWVLKVLNAWWNIYGGKILEARDQQEKQAPPVPYTGPPIDVKTLVDSYVNRLKSGMVPDKKLTDEERAEIAQKEGKEWKSDIERKAVSVLPDPERKVYTVETLKERNERIRGMQEKTFRERNPGASEEEVKLFMETMKQHEVKIPSK